MHTSQLLISLHMPLTVHCALSSVLADTSSLAFSCAPPCCCLLSCRCACRRLYEQWGFEATPWEDPLWMQDAEKGKMGRQRRIMMVKQLSGPALAASPWQHKD